MGFSIRDATPDDLATIVDYNIRLAKESEDIRLDPVVLGYGVRALLGDPSLGRYFLAVSGAKAGERIVGQTMITYEWSDWRNGVIWWLQSVYVHPDFRRLGVFRNLFEHVSRLSREEAGVVGLRLYVEEENTSAQATYERLGMARPGYFVLESLSRRLDKGTESTNR